MNATRLKAAARVATRPVVPEPHREDRLWDVEAVSIYLGVPVGTLYQWRCRGSGPAAFRVGKHLRCDPALVRDWLLLQAG